MELSDNATFGLTLLAMAVLTLLIGGLMLRFSASERTKLPSCAQVCYPNYPVSVKANLCFCDRSIEAVKR